MTKPTQMREADMQGPAGAAWRVDELAVCAANGHDPKDNNGWCWVVAAPGSHPYWWWYRVLLLNLKPVPWVKEPPKIYLEGATHELILDALNPDYYPPPVDDFPKYHLTPTNFAAQFIAESDEAAIKRVEFSVHEIVSGILSPDTDYRREWIKRYGDNMMKSRAVPIPPPYPPGDAQ